MCLSEHSNAVVRHSEIYLIQISKRSKTKQVLHLIVKFKQVSVEFNYKMKFYELITCILV
mgnify:CR=1 FL=1